MVSLFLDQELLSEHEVWSSQVRCAESGSITELELITNAEAAQ